MRDYLISKNEIIDKNEINYLQSFLFYKNNEDINRINERSGELFITV